MGEVEITRLAITGSDGAALPNRFFRQVDDSKTLAVILPGLNYSCDMPLLYYTARLMLERRTDVLQVHSDYTRPDFQSLSRQEQLARMGEAARSALERGMQQRRYSCLVLVGKSIGTLALAYLVSLGSVRQALTLWLTPLLRQPWLVEIAAQLTSPSLFVVGTGDATYDPAALSRIQADAGAETLLLEGANHSLEIPGNTGKSLEFLQRFTQNLTGFLMRNLAE